ncbi:hypothetical protein OG824_31795 [Streptomyces prunicolor]|uniref:hypothetical protein n=1 Tax=Streptomyces prunicolor TaxID=67348 RepID=UPI00224E1A61|nr:hypothetical protein [Streptomyces prunicolor]MCX5239794.1 hypothetical protein [Streptomyces prunicolor]
MEAPPSTQSIDKVSALYNGRRALYAPSVIAEAARLLDALFETAERHGHTRTSDHIGELATAAADATASKHRGPKEHRQAAEIHELHRELTQAFTEEGLTTTRCHVRLGVAVEPLSDGPRWVGRTGLAVALYTNSGWELMVNTSRTRVFTIYAPATAEGAREVAAIVHSILRGTLPDPFRADAR